MRPVPRVRHPDGIRWSTIPMVLRPTLPRPRRDMQALPPLRPDPPRRHVRLARCHARPGRGRADGGLQPRRRGRRCRSDRLRQRSPREALEARPDRPGDGPVRLAARCGGLVAGSGAGHPWSRSRCPRPPAALAVGAPPDLLCRPGRALPPRSGAAASSSPIRRFWYARFYARSVRLALVDRDFTRRRTPRSRWTKNNASAWRSSGTA